jgi:hypothetical protein
MDSASHHSDVAFFALRFEDGSNEHFELLLMVQSLQWQSIPNRSESPELDAFMASHHLSWYQVKRKLDALLEACVDGESRPCSSSVGCAASSVRIGRVQNDNVFTIK